MDQPNLITFEQLELYHKNAQQTINEISEQLEECRTFIKDINSRLNVHARSISTLTPPPKASSGCC